MGGPCPAPRGTIERGGKYMSTPPYKPLAELKAQEEALEVQLNRHFRDTKRLVLKVSVGAIVGFLAYAVLQPLVRKTNLSSEDATKKSSSDGSSSSSSSSKLWKTVLGRLVAKKSSRLAGLLNLGDLRVTIFGIILSQLVRSLVSAYVRRKSQTSS